MRSFQLLLPMVATFIALVPTPAASTLVYESTTLGPSVPPGTGLGISPTGQWIGIRFEVTADTNVESIGAHVVAKTFGNGLFFESLIALSSSTDFPDSTDLLSGDVLGSVILAPSAVSSGDAAGNLSVVLTPGWYALVVGSGLFGATGRGNLPRNGVHIGNPDKFFRNGGNWQEADNANAPRFFLSSTRVPPLDPCVVLDNGSGTITLPPEGCQYLGRNQVHTAINGLPPGTELTIVVRHRKFVCNGDQPLEQCTTPGGNLGGNIEIFDSTLHLEIAGTGLLSNFIKIVDLGAPVEIHTAPTTPGSFQDFDTEIVSLLAELTGDPDFASLTLMAGGPTLNSPGHTTLTRRGGPGSSFNVDSFFDVTYQIDFVGAPGSILDGMSGSSTGSITMGTPEIVLVPALSGRLFAVLVASIVAATGVIARCRR